MMPRGIIFLFTIASHILKYRGIFSNSPNEKVFAHCNALDFFAPLELERGKARKLMSKEQRFRLGYWQKTPLNPANHAPAGGEDPNPEIVYGIGISFDGHKR